MAIHNPGTLYSGGSAVVNATPFTNYILQAKARNQAKRDAIDGYYSQLGKTLTPTGVAADDVNDFMAKKSAWENDAIQNKDILNNPRDPNYGEAVTRNRFLYNDAQGQVAASQARVKDIHDFYSKYDPKNPLTEEGFQEFNKLSVPVAKGYKRPDITKILYEPKPYGYTEQNKDIQDNLKGITLGKIASKTISDPKTHTNTVTYDFQYSPEALQKIASKGADAYQRNPRIKKMVDETLDNEEHYKVLNPIFKEAYGRDIQSGEDRYTAELVLNAKEPYQQQLVTGYNPYLGQHTGGPGNGPNPQFNDVYGDIDEAVNAGNGMAKVSDLNIVGAGIISDVLRKRTSDPNEAADIINDGAYIKRDADGILRFHSKDDIISFPVTYKDINTIANTTAKGDNAVLNTTPKGPVKKEKKGFTLPQNFHP